MKFYSAQKNKGFTLIELLVVISVIGLLSSIVIGNLNQARKKARDAKRSADITEMRLALELYSQDHGGHYPHNTVTTGADKSNFDWSWVGSSPNCYVYVNGATSGGNTYSMADGLVSGGYISAISQDPKPGPNNTGQCYMYMSSDDGMYYKFSTIQTVETFNPRAVGNSLADPRRNNSFATMTDVDPETL
jgi:prepilin-type N-terminal cleavage/methylation domain-containing protein